MKNLPRSSLLGKGIAGRIIRLLFLFGAAPLVTLALIFIAFYVRWELEHIRSIQKEIVDRISAQISIHYENRLDDLRLFSTISNVQHIDREQVEILLSTLLDMGQEFDSFAVADLRGRVRARVSRYYSFRPDEMGSLDSEESFLDAKAGRVHFSEIEFSQYTNLPRIRVTLPIRNLRNDQIAGVLQVDVNIGRMWELISSYRIGENRYAYIVDHDGRLIVHKDIASVLQKRDLKDVRIVQNVIHEKTGVLSYRGLNGDPVIGASALIPSLRWGVIVEEPVRSAYRGLYVFSLLFLVITSLTVFFAIVIGMRFSFRSIIDPIINLQKGAEAIAGGEFDRKIAVERSDELGQLANAFNAMAENLQLTTVSRDRLAEEIEERKKIESELQKLAAVVEHSSELVILTTLDGRMVFLNEAGGGMLGIPPGDVGKRGIREVIPDDLKSKVEDEVLPAMLKKGRWEGDLQYRNLITGELIDVHAMTFVIRNADGEPLYLANISLNITEKKQSETERLHLATAIEQAAEGIYLTDTNWVIQYANPAFEHMLGYDKGEMIGWHARLLKSGKHDRLFYRKIRETLVGGKVWSGRAINKKKDGTFIDADVTLSPVRDRSGNIINYVCIHRDITREIGLEAKLLESQKMEAVGTLAGGIAHDFNNLLMGIQGYASLMMLDIDDSHPHYERLKRIEEQVQSGANLTKQLLGFARGGRYEIKPADMNDIIDKTSFMFGRTKKEIGIHRKLAEDLWAVDVDHGQMEQMLMNLYVNAWQAMPEGGELYLKTENVNVDDDQAQSYSIKPGRYVKVSVADTGTGMDGKTLERIFDPFFTTKAMGRGTGLGLAMVYGIIKGHGGMILVESQPGKGTAFDIYLPATEKTVVKDGAGAMEVLMGQETVLLVDDEQMVLDVTRGLLEFLGYKVYAAGSGQEAVAVYLEKRDEIDLVVLDMIMPGISGGETFDRLREIDPDIRIILSSGYSIEGQAKQILERGCNGFLQKPFQLESLSRKVRGVLGIKRPE